MKRKSILTTGMIIMVAVATLFLLIPSAAYAIQLPYCRFYGPVAMNGQNVPLGSIVSATISGVSAGPWTATVQGYGTNSWYILDVPKNTGGASKNGGAEGDIVNFSVTINGQVKQDPTTGTWLYLQSATTPDVFHGIALNIGALTITATGLSRSPVEVFPASPPTTWLPLPPPGWIIGQPYSSTVTAAGGTGTLTWSASGLPGGLTMSTAGVISGTPTASGLFNITVNVHDAASPANAASQFWQLMIYLAGDANGDGTVTIADVTYIERVILGLSPPTAGSDANLNGAVSIVDVTKAERIILGLP